MKNETSTIVLQSPVQPGRRRRFSRSQKREIVAETLEPGATLSGTARKYGLAPSLLFRWKAALARPGSDTDESAAAPFLSQITKLQRKIDALEGILGKTVVENERLRALLSTHGLERGEADA